MFATTIDPDVLARLRAHSEATGETLARLIDRAVKKLLASEARAVEKEAARAA